MKFRKIQGKRLQQSCCQTTSSLLGSALLRATFLRINSRELLQHLRVVMNRLLPNCVTRGQILASPVLSIFSGIIRRRCLRNDSSSGLPPSRTMAAFPNKLILWLDPSRVGTTLQFFYYEPRYQRIRTHWTTGTAHH